MNIFRSLYEKMSARLERRHQKLTKRIALKAARYYWIGILRLQDEAIELTSRLTEKVPPVQKVVLNYLAERVLQGALHANFLFREYPYSSHADLAGINRGIIEASVNYLFLLDDPSGERTAAFWAKGGYEESLRNAGLKKWLDHKNTLISHLARSDYEPDYPSFENMLEKLSQWTGVAKPNKDSWPHFKARCKEVGELWKFIYEMEYKALSTWQHGDLSRIIISPSYARIDPAQMDRNVFESFGMIQWAFTLNYLFVHELAIRCDDPIKIEATDQLFHAALHMANAGIQEHIERHQPHKHR